MKRAYVGIMTALLLITMSGTVRAEENYGIEAGFKVWPNVWQRTIPGFGNTSSNTTELIGPVIEKKLRKDFFIEASYLFSTSNYEISEPTGNLTYKRQDLDFDVGYMIVPQFGVLAGYKYSLFNEMTMGFRDTLEGPVLGILGDAPISEKLSIYGRWEYLFTRSDSNDSGVGIRGESPGMLFEYGFKYNLTPKLWGTLGYRHETNKGKASDVQDNISGVIISGMIVF
jgi:hypothetical protein